MISMVCFIVAAICFLLAAFGVSSRVNVMALGLFFLAIAHVVGDRLVGD